MSTQTTNEDLELSVLETDATETPNAAQGVASGLSEPGASSEGRMPPGEGAGAASAAESRATKNEVTK